VTELIWPVKKNSSQIRQINSAFRDNFLKVTSPVLAGEIIWMAVT
jgi:hypothetical protein